MTASFSIDITAKLLANENITVVRDRVPTASFDVGNRILTIPQFVGLNSTIEDLFVCHEIGHALYTDYLTFDEILNDKNNLKYKSYLNVVEDVRIERLVKLKYPGSKKTFSSGYALLHEQDFFKLSGVNIDTLTLGDRLNLFYKGLSGKIVFVDSIENDFCQRLYKTETLLDCLSLAIELYNYDKEKQEQKDLSTSNVNNTEDKKQSNSLDQQYSEDELEDELEGELDNNTDDNDQRKKNQYDSLDEETGDDSEQSDKSGFDGSISSQEKLNSSLQDYSDVRNTYIDFNIVNTGDYPIVDYKTILIETEYADVIKPYDSWYNTKKYEGTDSDESFVKYLNKVKLNTKNAISYLKKEFDLRKSAESIKRTQVNKSGRLDVKKLYSYQINDDIFLKSTTVKDEKNHGMVFLLDWSSSMTYVMQKTIEQLYTLISFCKACNIPFKVYAFSDSYDSNGFIYNTKSTIAINSKRSIDLKDIENLTLLEFFSSDMTTHEFNIMISRLLRTTIWAPISNNQSHAKYCLNGTPLNKSLAYMNFYLPKFKKSLNLEKVTLITLTDGDSHSAFSYDYNKKYNVISPNTNKRYQIIGARKNEYKTFVYETKALISMIKDSGFTTIGLNITTSDHKSIENSLICSAIPSRISNYDNFNNTVKEIKRSESYIVKESYYDLAIIFPRMLKDENDVILTEDIGDMSSKKIANQFIKLNKNKSKQRLFLDAFIASIA